MAALTDELLGSSGFFVSVLSACLNTSNTSALYGEISVGCYIEVLMPRASSLMSVRAAGQTEDAAVILTENIHYKDIFHDFLALNCVHRLTDTENN